MRSIRIICLSGAVLCLLYLCVSQLFPLTPANRLSLLYNLPLFSAFFFWLYCRLRESTKISVTGIILDALIVCAAGSRFVRAVIPPSGHALFLSYSLLTTSNRLYRIVAAVLLALTIALMINQIIEAHGGQKLWDQVSGLKIRLRVGGNLLAAKLRSPRTRLMRVEIDASRIFACLSPFPRAGLRGVFEADSVRLETEEGVVVKERKITRDVDGRVERRLVWDDLDLLYFLGYALWNYSMTPFYFLWPGFECAEGEMWREKDGSCWRTLHVTYPPAFPTHSRQQSFYFDEQWLLRRLDYTAYVFGEWTRGAHYCEDHKNFDGLVFPTHRVVYPRLPSGHPLRLFSVMEGWVEDVEVVWKQVAK